jgi:hypothetical protein
MVITPSLLQSRQLIKEMLSDFVASGITKISSVAVYCDAVLHRKLATYYLIIGKLWGNHDAVERTFPHCRIHESLFTNLLSTSTKSSHQDHILQGKTGT